MPELNVSLIHNASRPPAPFTIRDWAAVGFRQSRIILSTFFVVFGLVLLVTWLTPAQYKSEVKILVKRERTDPIVSADGATQMSRNDVTEEDVNSEVEILKSQDLLEKVAVESGLTRNVRESRLRSFVMALGWVRDNRQTQGQDARTTLAARQLERDLKIEPLKKTRLISVTYSAKDPQLSRSVLQTLTRLYMEKHLDVHRVPGALDFFQTQAEQYKQELNEAEKKMASFGASKGVVAPQLEKEIVVRKLNDFDADVNQTQAAISATQRRIGELERLQSTRPARLTSQVRTSDNPQLLQQMKSTLLTLELKRTELLGKYAPDYPPVKEVEAQIAQTREALANAESTPLREEVTDRDATYEWITEELAKARAELTGLQARLSATTQSVAAYRRQAQELNTADIAHQDIARTRQAAEENFVLYSRKQEEARISEALDKKRIINVSVAEDPTLPAVPASPNWPLNLLIGSLLAGFAALGLGLARDYMDASFRTPDEVEVYLSVPVLASLSLEAGES